MSWSLPASVSFSGLVLVGLAIPMLRGAVPRNRFYGFRTPTTLARDEVWYPANRLAARWMIGAGIAMIAVSPLLILTPDTARNELYLAVVLGPLGCAIAASFIGLRRIVREADRGG